MVRPIRIIKIIKGTIGREFYFLLAGTVYILLKRDNNSIKK